MKKRLYVSNHTMGTMHIHTGKNQKRPQSKELSYGQEIMNIIFSI